MRHTRISVLLKVHKSAAKWAYDGDSVAAGAAVPLEHDVASLVDSNAVILVMDRAIEG